MRYLVFGLLLVTGCVTTGPTLQVWRGRERTGIVVQKLSAFNLAPDWEQKRTANIMMQVKCGKGLTPVVVEEGVSTREHEYAVGGSFVNKSAGGSAWSAGTTADSVYYWAFDCTAD